MSQAFAYEGEMDSAVAPPSPAARRTLALSWLGFATLALLLLFPFRYTSHAELSFDVAAQPPPGAVRGVMQLLTSRELAFDVVRSLDRADVLALVRDGGTLSLALWRNAENEDAAVRARAARILGRSLSVNAQQGGRALDIAISLANARLAARVADAYAGALLTLDASVRGPSDAAREGTPPLRLAHAATVPRLPDSPDAGRLLVLAIATAVISAATVRLRHRRMLRQGPIESRVLPQEVKGDRRVTWLRAASGAGLAPDAAVERLADYLEQTSACRLVVLTSSDLPGASAACALALTRRLAETEDQVVLVALDGEMAECAALVADPRAPGVAELLFGVAGFSEAIHRDPQSRAHIIPPGRDSRGGASVVNADRLTLILQSLQQTYARVVVCAPRLAGTPGAERLAALSPVLVAVHEEDPATAGAVETYDGLAAKGFTSVVMAPLLLAPAPLDGETDASAPAHGLPVPTLMAPLTAPTSVAA